MKRGAAKRAKRAKRAEVEAEPKPKVEAKAEPKVEEPKPKVEVNCRQYRGGEDFSPVVESRENVTTMIVADGHGRQCNGNQNDVIILLEENQQAILDLAFISPEKAIRRAQKLAKSCRAGAMICIAKITTLETRETRVETCSLGDCVFQIYQDGRRVFKQPTQDGAQDGDNTNIKKHGAYFHHPPNHVHPEGVRIQTYAALGDGLTCEPEMRTFDIRGDFQIVAGSDGIALSREGNVLALETTRWTKYFENMMTKKLATIDLSIDHIPHDFQIAGEKNWEMIKIIRELRNANQAKSIVLISALFWLSKYKYGDVDDISCVYYEKV